MDYEFFGGLVLAFVGGMTLNFMPCVFPILSLKIMSIVRSNSEQSRGLWIDGVAYTMGVAASMLVLSVCLLTVRYSSEAALGWGFQMQSPSVVSVLICVTFLAGLSLSGFFDIPIQFTFMGSAGNRNFRSFLTGVMTTVLGTPCAAPFMAGALSYAATQTPLRAVLIFQVLAVGISIPYLLFTTFPYFASIMPKPGKWMENLKQLLAFPMYVSTVWLIHILVRQLGVSVITPALLFLTGIAFIIWLLKFIAGRKYTNLVTLSIIILCMVMASVYSGRIFIESAEVSRNSETNASFPAFSLRGLEIMLEEGRNVFVAVSAEWCLTCKVNEVILESEYVQNVLREMDIMYIKADWTRMDDEIAKYLRTNESNSVPFYALYIKGKKTQPIPRILTEKRLIEILTKAKH